MHPQTDIIVLAHNQLAITKKFCELIFKNTDNFRLIFVDNASTDGTVEYINKLKKQYNQLYVIRLENNEGVSGGRNAAYKYIEADFFICLDNDQFVNSGWLEELHSIRKHFDFDFLATDAWLLYPPDTKGVLMINGHQTAKRDYFPMNRCVDRTDKYSYAGGGGTLIKTSAAKALQFDDGTLYDMRFNPYAFEDPDLSWRALQADMKIGWNYKSSIVHLGNKTTATQKSFSRMHQFYKSLKLFQNKWYPYYPEPMNMPIIPIIISNQEHLHGQTH